VTTMPQAVIDRVTLIVSDLDRTEDDYVRTFGCTVEHRAHIEPALTGVPAMTSWRLTPRCGSAHSRDCRRARPPRHTPLADHDFMVLYGGVRAALVTGPDDHRFLVEEPAAT
jgi:catechol 2,3-dioxygenase-like lactoylglutathione lyase family enzyme